MIRKKSLFVKMLKIRNLAYELVSSTMYNINTEQETCPECGNSGLCVHAYYSRTIIDFDGHGPVSNKTRILRTACPCGHTHAILFDVLIPYERHSLFFVLRVLGEYFLHLYSVEKLCERFQITQKRLYAWLGKWNEHKKAWLGVLEDLETSPRRFLFSLVRQTSYSGFSASFINKTSVSFLQTHANPPTAHYAQCIFHPDYSFSYTTRSLP